ncbi:MAG: hypothetical protein O7B99_08360 [Planctomycetota bacterium]|nr:hypothetical protein [Planctomycetota bacterium]
MKNVTRIALALLFAAALVASVRAVQSAVQLGGKEPRRRAVEVTPTAREDVSALLYARPFLLDRGYDHVWRRDVGWVQSGWVLVLEVDPELARPTQEFHPVLYAGDEVLERINHGFPSGRIVAVLPSALDIDGAPTVDLAATPIWFGTPRLPEQVDARIVAEELALARQRGAEPFPADMIAAAANRGGAVIAFPSRDELHRFAAELVLAYAPQEDEHARNMLAPPVR